MILNSSLAFCWACCVATCSRKARLTRIPGRLFPARPRTPHGAPPAHTRSTQISYTKILVAVSQLGPSPAPILVLPIFRPARSVIPTTLTPILTRRIILDSPLLTPTILTILTQDSGAALRSPESPRSSTQNHPRRRPGDGPGPQRRPGTAKPLPRGCFSTAISRSGAAGPTP